MTGPGEAASVMVRSAPLFAVVVAVALLLAGFGSVVDEDAVATAVRVESLTTSRSTLATTVKVAVPPTASDTSLKVTVSMPPAVDVTEVQAPVALAETNVVSAGNGKLTDGATEELGPWFVRLMV